MVRQRVELIQGISTREEVRDWQHRLSTSHISQPYLNVQSRVNKLDESIQSTVDDAPKDTLFIAGHDAFQYLEDRYGLRVESLTGLSPDDQPTPRDIERAQGIIDEYGLDYVCADPLESQTAAEQLVAETDATEVLPLTAIPGQTQSWADEDWGYIDVMENVNLDTLETALNA